MIKKRVLHLIAVLILLFTFQASCSPEKLEKDIPVEPVGSPSVKPSEKPPLKPGQKAPPPADGQSPETQAAGMMIKNGNLNEAEKILKKNPDNFDNIYMMGILERERGNYDEALKYLNKALEKNPEHAKSIKYRGYVNFFTGNYPQAIADLEKVMKMHPEDPEIYYGLAMIYKQQGKTQEAETFAMKGMDLELGAKNRKKNPKTEYNTPDPNRLAVLQSIAGNKAKDKIIEIARMDYEKDPANPEAVSKFAILLYDYGKADESKKIIEQAFGRVPKASQYEIHRVMGEFLIMERQYQQAEKEYEEAISMAPKSAKTDTNTNAVLAELYNLYGDSFLEQNKFEQAEEMFHKSIEYSNKIIRTGDTNLGDDKLTEYYVNMARLSLKMKDPVKADEFIKKAEALKPDDLKENQSGDVASIRAEWFAYKGQYEDAVKILSDMAGKNPDSLDQIYIRMAAAYSGMKDRKNAVDSLKKALEFGNNKRRLSFFLKENPNFDYIRNDPEVQALLK
jgi:tetratricopeptide (TPR) repeat protein